ncbi:unnamed protein product [Cladocopium goreaui]|uniref:Uncharacterized protein n=1 Tax=Cladocopium goreaui TaxID=2562237 RepID=A0A9P1CD55_9DINO|nr:unnamed protein product [Cladocopium goreaui]
MQLMELVGCTQTVRKTSRRTDTYSPAVAAVGQEIHPGRSSWKLPTRRRLTPACEATRQEAAAKALGLQACCGREFLADWSRMYRQRRPLGRTSHVRSHVDI